MQAPLIIIAFNRPQLLDTLLDVVRKHHNGYVYFVIDGPRLHNPDDFDKVQAVRSQAKAYLESKPGEIIASETNMGCYLRIKTGIDEVLEREPAAIILEDDCIPSPSFFAWINAMLNIYADDPSVACVCGTNLNELKGSEESHFFNIHAITWGWGVWSRSWRFFISDENEYWRERRAVSNQRLFRKPLRKWYWEMIWKKTYQGQITAWDYRWMFTLHRYSLLTVTSSVNLIENVGCGPDATNTGESVFLNRRAGEALTVKDKQKAKHVNLRYDQWVEDHFFSKSLRVRLQWCLRKFLGRFH